MADELVFRPLRYSVVRAEDLHLSRAARRAFVAQQVVRRDIRRLEEVAQREAARPGHQAADAHRPVTGS
jgi:DNA-binding transcriptional LysR family regulator